MREGLVPLKEAANKEYAEKKYIDALNKYSNCVTLAESVDLKDQLSKLHFNKGLCFLKLVYLPILIHRSN